MLLSFLLLSGMAAVGWAVLRLQLPPADFTFVNETEIKSLDPAIVTGVPEHRIIAMWRSLEEIWPRFRSPGPKLYYQEPKRAWSYVVRWCEHNDRIVDTLRGTSREFLLMNYRDFMEGEDGFARLQEFVGRPLDDERRKNLYRNTPQHSWVLDTAKALVKWRTGHDPEAVTERLRALVSA